MNTLSGIAVGQALLVSNKTNSTYLIAEGTQPAEGSTKGTISTAVSLSESVKAIPANSLEIWARVLGTVGTAKVSVQSTL